MQALVSIFNNCQFTSYYSNHRVAREFMDIESHQSLLKTAGSKDHTVGGAEGRYP